MKIYIKEHEFLKSIPNLPGVYKFYNQQSQTELLLYVGKAINLSKRIKSYFMNQKSLSPRIGLMVNKIDFIEITITDNELSALIIERNLIHTLKPKYNIVFRDDKTYALIKVSMHKFPKIEVYRGKVNNNDKFFGPFPNSSIIKSNMELITKTFKLRTCSDTEFVSRKHPCMLYQINKCSAPCVNYISVQDYQMQVDLTINFLNGMLSPIAKNLTELMSQFSMKQEFEKAAQVRDQLFMIKKLRDSQIVNNYNMPANIDLIFIDYNTQYIFIYLIRVRLGIYVGDKNFIIANNGEFIEDIIDELIRKTNGFIIQANTIYCNHILSPEFIANIYMFYKIKILTVPDKSIKHLMYSGNINLNKMKDQHKDNTYLMQGCDELCKLLNLETINRIECIDISHNHGDSTVGSLVVYEDNKITPSQYRRYNLDNDKNDRPINGNDILAIELLLSKRFKKNDTKIPDVIIIDGGLLQMEVVKKNIYKYGFYGKIIVISIFKGENRSHENDKIMLANGQIIEYSPKNVVFTLIQKLRDEAHRFAINNHRKRQIKKMSASNLDNLVNIGKKKKVSLLAQFGSVYNVSQASIEELMQIPGIGKKAAIIIFNHFHSAE